MTAQEEVNYPGRPFAIGVEAQDSPVDEIGDKLFTVYGHDGAQAFVPYFGTHELGGTPDQKIKGVLKINCGMLGDAGKYFKTGLAAVRAAGLEGSVAVFALQPTREPDVTAEHSISGLPDDAVSRARYAFWSTRKGPAGEMHNWKDGDNAHGPVPVSWYAVHDQFDTELILSDMFPNATFFTDDGNSAQGQTGERRAVAGVGPSAAALAKLQALDINYRYVASNPATHVYLDNWRPRSAPPEAYDWRYGLKNGPEYIRSQRLTTETCLARLASRDFILLLGQEDNKVTIGAEVHPAAIAQDPEGCEPNRLMRGRVWAQHHWELLQQHGPTKAGGSFNFLTVPRVGHSGADMFTSEVGLTAMFGDPSALAALNEL